MKRILFIAACFTPYLSIGQDIKYDEFVPTPISGEQNIYEKIAVQERREIAHVVVSEADAKYQLKVHRVIDTRQKMNKILTWPKNPLSQYIYNFAIDGVVKAYRDDSLYGYYDNEKIINLVSYEMTVPIQNPLNPDDPFDVIDTTIREVLEHYKYQKFMLLEDWYFDHRHSVMKPRIIAIAPMMKRIFGGEELPEMPIYWLKMDDLRPLLINLELFNPHNDAVRISFDHFFEFRLFDSYIVKRSNMYDYFIADMEEFKDDNMASLLEGEKIKNDLFIFEHDLWEY